MLESTDSDITIVRRVQEGHKDSFDILVMRYQFRIMKMITRYVRDPVEAADITQETFIKAYNSLENFRGDSAFYTWLYRIAMNCSKNYLVLSSRKLLDPEMDIEDFEASSSSAHINEFGTPESILMTSETDHEVTDVIQCLPKDLRTAITLREIDGLSYEDIAGVMLCPVGTVRSRIHRAREYMERRLKRLES
jgi:RNA polymerase sigma-70 factor, ECF subfamily